MGFDRFRWVMSASGVENWKISKFYDLLKIYKLYKKIYHCDKLQHICPPCAVLQKEKLAKQEMTFVMRKLPSSAEATVYQNSKLLSPEVVYFAEPVKTSLWAAWTEQHEE